MSKLAAMKSAQGTILVMDSTIACLTIIKYSWSTSFVVILISS